MDTTACLMSLLEQHRTYVVGTLRFIKQVNKVSCKQAARSFFSVIKWQHPKEADGGQKGAKGGGRVEERPQALWSPKQRQIGR